MAIKASDQITITDITDAYSVILTSEVYSFVGGTTGASAGAKCSTQVVAFCGSNQCNVVNVNKNDIICPSGISVDVKNSGTNTVTIDFTLTADLTDAVEATIPVLVDGITVNKKFSFAVAKTGQQGEKGNKGDPGAAGADAIMLSVTSSNGTVFKNNSGSTILTAHVYVAGIEKTISDAGVVADSLGTIKWYKVGTSASIKTGKTLTINANDVTNVQAYTCQLEG